MSQRNPLKRGVLSREDIELWTHVVRSITPMPGRRPQQPETLPTPTQTPEDKPEKDLSKPFLPAWSPPSQTRPAGPPLQPLERRVRQKLARGQAEVDGVIDLHGMRQPEAHGALLAFIRRAQASGASVVLVVTGKGAPGLDPERGVLRRLVPHWLADPALRGAVLGYEGAARGHGGEGALYVRIRKARPPRS